MIFVAFLEGLFVLLKLQQEWSPGGEHGREVGCWLLVISLLGAWGWGSRTRAGGKQEGLPHPGLAVNFLASALGQGKGRASGLVIAGVSLNLLGSLHPSL